MGQSEIWGFLKISYLSPSPAPCSMLLDWVPPYFYSVLFLSFSDSSQSHWAFPAFNLWPAFLFSPVDGFLFSTFSLISCHLRANPSPLYLTCQPVCSSDFNVAHATLQLMSAMLSVPSPHPCFCCIFPFLLIWFHCLSSDCLCSCMLGFSPCNSHSRSFEPLSVVCFSCVFRLAFL